MDPVLRPYAEADFVQAGRIWREVGWVEDDDDDAALRRFLSIGNAGVAEVNGEVESLVHWTRGSLRHEDIDLPLAVVSAVTTSLVGRKLGLASRLTHRALAEAAEAGCAVGALGMFEQGFYDRLGFGTGAYVHEFCFDPTSLLVDGPYRMPERLTLDDHVDMHAALTGRLRGHGAVTLDPPESLAAEIEWLDDPLLALGYRTNGRLTHFIAGSVKGEHGPAEIRWIAYETTDQLLELLRLIKALGDQIYSVKMFEPPEIQLQVLLGAPVRHRAMSDQSEHRNSHETDSWWQARILDLEACVGALKVPAAPVVFDLILTDPLADRAVGRPGEQWSGIGGEYSMDLGAASSVSVGRRDDVPVLTCSVNALTRLWLGVRPATSLAVTDDLSGPSNLLGALDRALRFPVPSPGWDF